MDAAKPQFIRRLYIGDNLAVMRGLELESVDLIYLDPPFNSKSIYKGAMGSKAANQQFKDTWTMSDITADEKETLDTLNPDAAELINVLGAANGESWKAYLTFMAVRLDEMHRLLKPTGSIYLHCDPTMSHGLKLLMDMVFGRANFRNEIVWHYHAGMSSKKDFRRKHDTILRYSKSQDYVAIQVQVPRRMDPRRFKYTDEDGRRYHINGFGKKFYQDEGRIPDDVWTYCDDKRFTQINSQSKERTGWATQKPLALLERIIKASSNKGDVVLDPFCGCGTACVAAEDLGQQWIGIDIDPASAKIMQERLEGESSEGGKKKVENRSILDWRDVEVINARQAKNLPQRSGVREIDKNDRRVRAELYHRQGGKCKARYCPNGSGKIPFHFMEIDRIKSGKRGGRYTSDNVQLLCSTCNRSKGAGTMVELERKNLQKRAELEGLAAKDGG